MSTAQVGWIEVMDHGIAWTDGGRISGLARLDLSSGNQQTWANVGGLGWIWFVGLDSRGNALAVLFCLGREQPMADWLLSARQRSKFRSQTLTSISTASQTTTARGWLAPTEFTSSTLTTRSRRFPMRLAAPSLVHAIELSARACRRHERPLHIRRHRRPCPRRHGPFLQVHRRRAGAWEHARGNGRNLSEAGSLRIKPERVPAAEPDPVRIS